MSKPKPLWETQGGWGRAVQGGEDWNPPPVPYGLQNWKPGKRQPLRVKGKGSLVPFLRERKMI